MDGQEREDNGSPIISLVPLSLWTKAMIVSMVYEDRVGLTLLTEINRTFHDRDTAKYAAWGTRTVIAVFFLTAAAFALIME